MPQDLSVIAFHALRRRFFDDQGRPITFDLRDKRNTQDDPFDVEVYDTIRAAAAEDISSVRAPGPLVSPDMALVRPASCAGKSREQLRNDSTALVAIEVKKLERSPNGQVGRASGLDYNSTPPCGTVRVYDRAGAPVDMRGFYLFACLESGETPGSNRVTALALCDGDLLNADFKYYTDITGQRSKDIGVGTYGDGANRNRPMVIFGNPLGAIVLDRAVTLVHRSADLATDTLVRVGTISRKEAIEGHLITFTCYRDRRDTVREFEAVDPFPSPKNRSAQTSGRGRFTLPIRLDR
jgi:hypothetical protein